MDWKSVMERNENNKNPQKKPTPALEDAQSKKGGFKEDSQKS